MPALRWRGVARLIVASVALFHFSAHAQQSPESPVRGLYNWIHTTFDAEQSFAFYRDVLGIELASSPFVGAAAPPEGIRSVAAALSDELVSNLTNTPGARFRTVFMRASNTPFGLELSEFFDIARSGRLANPWDPGASRLIFAVRNLDVVVAALRARAAPIVSLGAMPVETAAGLAILVRDPDGYLVELRQASPAEIVAAAPTGEVIDTAIGITVADLDRAMTFYGDLLGFKLGERRGASAAELRLNGLASGELTKLATAIPGVDAAVHFSAFRVPADVPPASPFRWRIQDLGAPQFQLQVVGLDELLERTAAAGYGFLSVGGRPIQRPFGRFVFVIDADGVLVEYVEPAVRR